MHPRLEKQQMTNGFDDIPEPVRENDRNAEALKREHIYGFLRTAHIQRKTGKYYYLNERVHSGSGKKELENEVDNRTDHSERRVRPNDFLLKISHGCSPNYRAHYLEHTNVLSQLKSDF